MEQTAAFREPSVSFLGQRAPCLTKVAAERRVVEEVVQALAVEALVDVTVEEGPVSRDAYHDLHPQLVRQDSCAAVIDQVGFGVGTQLNLALQDVDRVVDRISGLAFT